MPVSDADSRRITQPCASIKLLATRKLREIHAGVLCGRLAAAVLSLSKGGDPAAPSDTATLLRLHPSHESLRGRRPPCG